MCFGLGVCVWLSISDGSCLRFRLTLGLSVGLGLDLRQGSGIRVSNRFRI